MKLETLKFSDFPIWAEAESEVERLAMRGSLARVSVTGHGQRLLFHYLATKHLVAILPEPFKLEAERRINTYCNTTGNEFKFHTLVELLEKDRDAIDRLLAKKSLARSKGMERADVLAITLNATKNTNTEAGFAKPRVRKGVKGMTAVNPQEAAGAVNVICHPTEIGIEGRGYEMRPRESLCRKCKIPGHEEVDCPHYEDPPSKYMCNYCHMDAYHLKDQCLFKSKGLQRWGMKPAVGLRAGAKTFLAKN